MNAPYLFREEVQSVMFHSTRHINTHKKRKLWEFLELDTVGIETVKHILIKCAQYIKLVC